ncbi:MAG: bifunctional hydroxymethylpyrimidine kinase/phosphomethylpyrimidine kinase [Desulfobulbaceae bacterium]|nr:bifunctional hydroxymethylpyrimidine kinase/phosphomethylpyrimidine kinase [Desulfobulbaceae bacterium]
MPTNNKRPQAALTIAGSDPSGGAGIQADIKTFTVIGVYCGAVITSLTAQNTMGVDSYLPLPASFVKKQAELVLEDLDISHIKIGMVGSTDIAEALGEILQQFNGEVIYDPVLKSSSGASLFTESDLTAIAEHIISRVTVLTPNISELERLTSQDCTESEKAIQASRNLLMVHPRLKAVCLKGGHLNVRDKTVTDFLIRKTEQKDSKSKQIVIDQVNHPRITTTNSHGTGCTFASAYAAFHMQTESRLMAFQKTVHFMDTLINKSRSYTMGHGTGPLLHSLWMKSLS